LLHLVGDLFELYMFQSKYRPSLG